MFVPSDDYFTKKFESIKKKISVKLDIDLNQLGSLNFSPSAPSDVGTLVNGTYVSFVNFGFIRDNIGLIRALLGTVLYLFLFYYHYRMAVKLIRGIDVGGCK